MTFLLFGQMEFAETLQSAKCGCIYVSAVGVLINHSSVSDSETEVAGVSVKLVGSHIGSFILVSVLGDGDSHVVETVGTDSDDSENEEVLHDLVPFSFVSFQCECTIAHSGRNVKSYFSERAGR